MFQINEDLSIYATRGDIVYFSVGAKNTVNGETYKFQSGDVVRIKVFGKKDCETVVLQKDFPVTAESETVEIFLTEEDTKIGGVISKHKDYWYEVELNPESNPQTIIGYDDDGAKIFRLFPEGRDLTENDPVITPEDIPIVDTELDLTSKRPVENQAIARAVERLKGSIKETSTILTEKISNVSAMAKNTESELKIERARVDNIVSGNTANGDEVTDIRVGVDGITYGSAGTAVREQFNKSVMGLGRIDQSIEADLNNLKVNSIHYVADWTGMINLPVNKVGCCVTLSADDIGRGLQFYSTNTGELYYRIFWTPVNGEKSWKAWKNTDFTEEISKCVFGAGYIIEGDLNNVEVNKVLSVTDWTNVKNLPTQTVGTCATFSSDVDGKRGFQIYVCKDGTTFNRAFWTISTGEKSFSKWSSEKPFPNILVYPTIYAVVGTELNLYYYQMFDCLDWKSEVAPTFTYNGTGAKGYDDRISIIPTEAGTFTLNIIMHKVIDGVNVTSAKYPVTVKVSAAKTPSKSSKVLFLGDSRTDFARICKYPVNILGKSVEFIGTLSENGYMHEGRSGWTAEGYCTLAERKGVLNPFWDGSKFNFSHYMQKNNFTDLEYVNLLFGVNSLYSDSSPAYIEQIIDSIHEYDSNIKITVMTEYVLPYSAYYSGSYHRCSLGRAFYHKIVDKFKDRENENIFVLSTNLVIDDKFDWRSIEIPISQFNNGKVAVISDNIHPKDCGYNKIGSLWTNFYLYNKGATI